MGKNDVELMAHLIRRAGFGATRDELEAYTALGYEEMVEELLEPAGPQVMASDLMRRYHPEQSGMLGSSGPATSWLYRMITTSDPLREKMALFWHGIFATAFTKVTNGKMLNDQLRMFLRLGLGNFKTLLLELSKDPAMIAMLDNHDNHKGAINENYGRELLELFSMGAGNYTEQDIKECARAFTGWTIGNAEYQVIKMRRCSAWPHGRIAGFFEYHGDDHDDGDKVFLGHRGRFNGEDVIDIICQQPATARFISRHLYSFFVTEEPPVPQWRFTEPRDPQAIQTLSQAYFESGYDIRSMVRVLLKSDFFRSETCWYAKVKSPTELVAGVLRLTGEMQRPRREMQQRFAQTIFMGQSLLNPPTVEGWHVGTEWIESGTLMERINFASERLADVQAPGVRAMIERIMADSGSVMLAERLVDGCLDQMGAISVSPQTRSTLVDFASRGGDLDLSTPEAQQQAQQRVAETLQLVAATHEFQRT